MVAWIRNHNDLARAFANQRKALLSSCNAYDKGEEWEATRIATAIYVLVHDKGKRDRSLLSQMGVKESMRFLASGKPVDPKNLAGDTPLVSFEIGGGQHVRCLPHLEKGSQFHREVGFWTWWERDLVYRSGDNSQKICRKKLVFALRNNEGGSHWDGVIHDPNYIGLAGGAGWRSVIGNDDQPVKSIESASMRQIGWELLESLDRSGVT